MEESVKKTSYKISKNLKNLYLDPNNYRFIDHPDYVKVSNEELLDTSVQSRTRKFIEGKNRKNIEDLLDSFKTNGFMDIDVIQVKEIAQNQFLVVEGNRRVAALKVLQDEYNNHNDIGKLDPSIFNSVPFEIHDGEDLKTHQIIMGLKHITKSKSWPALNQAQLINDIMNDYSDPIEGENFIHNSMGISVTKIRKYIRTIKLIEHYKKSDYRDRFTTNMYSIFEEIIKKPKLKEWIGFNDYTYEVSNYYNLNRLFSWISPQEELEYELNDEGEEEEIVTIGEPLITRALEIRTLTEILNDEKALSKLEAGLDVTEASKNSEQVGKNRLQEAIGNAKSDIINAIYFREYLNDDDLISLEEIQKNISKLLPKKSSIDFKSDKNSDVYFKVGQINHFSEIDIENYRIFNNFKINGFRRVNIFAGLNNSGKTTLLEAIYLLTIQNDIKSFFEFIKLKNKFHSLDTNWVKTQLEEGHIKGKFNDTETEIYLKNYKTEEDIDKIDYEKTIEIIASVEDEQEVSKMHLFISKDPQLHFKNITYLCSSMFKSPYFYSHTDLLNSHAISVQKKSMDTILKFIQKIDNDIQSIELVEHYGVKRFSVISNKFAEGKDLTTYGEGLQRVFEIALSFAYCKNGVLLIDEIETAIHKSMLIEFTALIQQLAEQFNVQVFITSHSKECIDAFIQNEYHNDDIMAYLLQNTNGEFSYKYVDGGRLYTLVQDIDLDIRED